jgi:hypothetical protein
VASDPDSAAHGPRKEAQHLEAAGQIRQAIDLLSNAVGAHPDPESEAYLVVLRHRLYRHEAGGAGSGHTPDPVDDPFPDHHGSPPEITPDQLTAEVLGGAIAHHGCLLVRGLFTTEESEQLRTRIQEAFVAIDDTLQGDGSAEGSALPADDPGFVQFTDDGIEDLALQRRWVRHGGGVWGVESPRTMARILDLYEQRGLIGAVTEHLGSRPALALNKFTLRHVTAEAIASWHQDGAFMGSELRSVNAWVALTPCGGDLPAPGLSILPRRLDQLAETGTEGALMDSAVGDGVIDRLATDAPVIRPVFAPGDALLFDQLFLHATGTHPGITGERYAIESWFFEPSDVPEDYIGIAV